MKKLFLSVAVAAQMSAAVSAGQFIHDEASLLAAIELANNVSKIKTLVFAKDAEIDLTQPVVYTGTQPLRVIGNGAVIDGSLAGSFVLDEDLTAVTEDGTLVFNNAKSISISNLSVINSATRGIVINVPEDAEGKDLRVRLNKVTIADSALFGLHVDDNADEFDDGESGSSIGIRLDLTDSVFVGNGTGAIDFDGVRVDERGEGSIIATIRRTIIDENGGDGIELDEAGTGSVLANVSFSSFNGNGFYNEEDLDDAFDIDEADEGNIRVSIFKSEASDNMDEGLDFDEEGEGSAYVRINKFDANNNADEGIKVDEEDAGNIIATIKKTDVLDNGDDGIQFTEIGEGLIGAEIAKVEASNNAKYGIKMEQWIIEDEDESAEDAGYLKAKGVVLEGNGKGDDIKVNNIEVE